VATEGRCKDVLAELCKAILTAAVGDGKSSDCNFMVSYIAHEFPAEPEIHRVDPESGSTLRLF
jgi:hypothetical protein